jgi:hypothetical protein
MKYGLLALAALTMIASLGAVGGAGGVFAQPADPGGDLERNDPKDPKLAKKWLTAAQQLMQKGSLLAARNRPEEAKAAFENAVTAYLHAISAGDDVNIYFDLATAEDKLGKLDEAVKYLRRIVNTEIGVRPDVVKKATARLEDLSTKVGVMTLTVTPVGTSITLGGAELGTAPLPEPLVLMPGTYTLSFQADGWQPKEAEITIEPGSETERTVALDPVKVIVEPVKPAPVAEPLHEQRNQPPAWPLYAGAGLAGAGVLGAGIFGVLAVSQHTTFTAASTSKLDREDARINGRRFALIADLSLAEAVVAAGFTGYWYFYKYRRALPKLPELQARHPSPVKAKLDVVPWVQPRSGGIIIAGWL